MSLIAAVGSRMQALVTMVVLLSSGRLDCEASTVQDKISVLLLFLH